MHRAPARVLFAALLLLAGGSALRAQRAPALEVRLPPPELLARVGPLVIASNMLSTQRTREPLAAGFPARFHFLVALWSEAALGNQVERRAEYDVLVRFGVMDKKYQVVQIVNDDTLQLGKFDRVEDAEGAIARPTRVPIRAFASKRPFYYRVTLDVQILGASDLDEVNRWRKGELEPAIHGQRDPGTALTRSLRMLTSRILGGDSREFEAATPAFRVP